MSIWLEDKIRDAILSVRWRRAGEGLHPGYFAAATLESLQLKGSAASFLARYISESLIADWDSKEHDSVKGELDEFSLEEIADYLEDEGYTVSSPD